MDKQIELLQTIADKLDDIAVYVQDNYSEASETHLPEIYDAIYDVALRAQPSWRYLIENSDNFPADSTLTSNGNDGWELVSINYVEKKEMLTTSGYWATTYKRKY